MIVGAILSATVVGTSAAVIFIVVFDFRATISTASVEQV